MTEPSGFDSILNKEGTVSDLLKGTPTPKWMQHPDLTGNFKFTLPSFTKETLDEYIHHLKTAYQPPPQSILDELESFDQKAKQAAEQRAKQLRKAKDEIPIPCVGGSADGQMYASHLKRIKIASAKLRGRDYYTSDEGLSAYDSAAPYNTGEYVRVTVNNWARETVSPGTILTIYLYQPLLKAMRGDTASPTLVRLIEKSITKAFIKDQVNQQMKRAMNAK